VEEEKVRRNERGLGKSFFKNNATEKFFGGFLLKSKIMLGYRLCHIYPLKKY